MKTHHILKSAPLYPLSLKRSLEAPDAIYASGNLDLLSHEKIVAVVGSTSATENGAEIARRVVKYCKGEGAAIVYSLSLGIDSAVHRACVEFGAHQIMVIDEGFNKIPSNVGSTVDEVIKRGGLCISGSPPHTHKHSTLFMLRNRIQVGLSKCSIVVESDIVSEAMNHAEYCTQEQHPLFVVTPWSDNPHALYCEGNKQMIKEMGAQPISGRSDYNRIGDYLMF